MYDFISGIVHSKTLEYIVLSNNGIGYKINCSSFCSSAATIGEECTLYVYLNVREDDFSLFGFYSLDERELFTNLIKVPKIGPKVAISILSGLTTDAFKSAIVNGDIALLSKVPGIGKKTAEKLIVELKDKFKGSINSTISFVSNNFEPSKREELIEALSYLGYNEKEILSMINGLSFDDCNVDELIKLALKNK